SYTCSDGTTTAQGNEHRQLRGPRCCAHPRTAGRAQLDDGEASRQAPRACRQGRACHPDPHPVRLRTRQRGRRGRPALEAGPALRSRIRLHDGSRLASDRVIWAISSPFQSISRILKYFWAILLTMYYRILIIRSWKPTLTMQGGKP